MINCVIYCRVSSRDQIEGTSLESQETACRDYAQHHGMAVVKVFVEEGESAKFAQRPQLLSLLEFCKNKSRSIETLIVWKLDRFARNVEDHFAIKATLRRHGVRVVSVTEPLETDANGRLMETILAGFAQFDNDIRSIRSIQGMQARLKEGIFPWKPPLGYLPPKIGKKTKADQPDPGTFDLLRRAWQMLASDAYTLAEVLRLLRTSCVCGANGRPISRQTVGQIFRNDFYAGVLRDPWTGDEYPGRHQPMVTRDEFERVQRNLGMRRPNARFHYRVRPEFPLRGLVRCGSCLQYMTASFAKGRCQYYPYYHCFRARCATRTKNYPLDAVHEEFEQFLADASLPRPMGRAIVDQLQALLANQTATAAAEEQKRREEVRRHERQLQELIVIRADRLISDEEFASQRDRVRQALQEVNSRGVARLSLFDHDLERVVARFADLRETWHATAPGDRQVLGELLLPVGYVFRRIRTAEKGLLINVFNGSRDGDANVVPLAPSNLNTVIEAMHRFLCLGRPDGKSELSAA
jgi:DNA invertase Pin-like site-specific DNA recombinase